MDPERVEATLRSLFSTDSPVPRGRGCVAVYLFGSVARNECGPESDVDIGVLYAEDPPRVFEGLGLELESEIERYLGLPVQLVVLNRAPADLVHRVLLDGKLILDLDPSRRIRFEVQKRNEYFDLLPHLDRYRRVRRAS